MNIKQNKIIFYYFNRTTIINRLFLCTVFIFFVRRNTRFLCVSVLFSFLEDNFAIVQMRIRSYLRLCYVSADLSQDYHKTRELEYSAISLFLSLSLFYTIFESTEYLVEKMDCLRPLVNDIINRSEPRAFWWKRFLSRSFLHSENTQSFKDW